MALGGCGKAVMATAPETQLEREDLVAVARVLRSVEGPTDNEVRAARAAWPLLVDGIPHQLSASARARLAAAEQAAAKLPLPAPAGETEAAALTGPGSPLAGRYRDFQKLCSASWRLLGDAVRELEQGGAPARYARANSALYIEGIYDSNYSIGEAGKQLQGAYEAMGAARALGGALGAGEVAQIARSYAPTRDRLEPHERVKLGS